MTENFLPFSKPSMDQATIDEVVACLKSGWLTTGPRTKKFEQALATYLGAPQALALTSATAGLHLALKSLDLQLGDEVITTPLTFVATLNTIIHAGGKPVLVDVELDTYNIDVEQIAAAITPRTRAIMPVHYAGLPVDLDAIYALAKQHNLRVIEDAAHAIGAEYHDKKIGSFGDIQVFSFHPNKVMTSGEGGCITTRDESLIKFINTQRFHGIDRDAFDRNTKAGSQHYDVIAPGYKYNMLDLQAAIGLHQLAALDNYIAKRTGLAQRYNEAFAAWGKLILPPLASANVKHAWYIYAPRINAAISRDEFMQQLKELNIGSGLHYQAAHLFKFYQQLGYKRGQFPNAEKISDSIVSLPLFPDMTAAEQDRVIAAMRKILQKEVS